ncbi:MAG: hypothetical protein ACHQ4J_06025 [Candidatus Binatia bacterium]
MLLPDEPTLRQMSGRFFVRHQLDPAAIDTYVKAPAPDERLGLARQLLQGLPEAE